MTEGGRRFADVAGQLREVVVVGANDVGGMIVRGAEGVYVVGTGNVGVAETFITLGLIYFVVMLAAAFSYRLPAPGWKPAGWAPPDAAHRAKRMISAHNVHIDEALKTRQFYQLWIVLCFNVTAGIGVLGVAQTMMTEIFGTTLPAIVDSSFAATYVVMISLFNMIGRFVWASSSDYIGRRNTYWIFFALGIAPLSVDSVGRTPGQRGAVRHLARLLLCGDDDHLHDVRRRVRDDSGVSRRHVRHALRRRHPRPPADGVEPRRRARPGGQSRCCASARSTLRFAISSATVDPERFRQAFGAGIEQLDALVAQQTVTIAKLMEIAPPGTVDPTPSLYNLTMYLMAALLAIALVANALMRARRCETSHGGDRGRSGAVTTMTTARLSTLACAALAAALQAAASAPPNPLRRRPRRSRSSPSTRTSTSRSTLRRPTSIR